MEHKIKESVPVILFQAQCIESQTSLEEQMEASHQRKMLAFTTAIHDVVDNMKQLDLGEFAWLEQSKCCALIIAASIFGEKASCRLEPGPKSRIVLGFFLTKTAGKSLACNIRVLLFRLLRQKEKISGFQSPTALTLGHRNHRQK